MQSTTTAKLLTRKVLSFSQIAFYTKKQRHHSGEQCLYYISYISANYNDVRFDEIVNDFFNVPPENVPPVVTSLNTVPPVTVPPV